MLVDDGTTVADAYGLSGLPFFVFLDAAASWWSAAPVS